MTIAAIREKICDYIRVADDKKVQAIYTILEDQISGGTEWWKSKEILDDFDNRLENWKTGKEKSFSLTDMEAEFEELRKRRSAL